MELQKEIEALNYSQEELKNRLDKDTQKKIGAILDILEIGKPSIAHLALKRTFEHFDSSLVAFGS